MSDRPGVVKSRWETPTVAGVSRNLANRAAARRSKSRGRPLAHIQTQAGANGGGVSRSRPAPSDKFWEAGRVPEFVNKSSEDPQSSIKGR